MASKSKTNWEEVDRQILAALDLRSEYESLGVRLNGDDPGPDGWLSCHAVDREDNNASAAVNVHTGRYRDMGGEGASLNLWEFACKAGKFANWREARADFAKRAGVKMPAGRPPADPAEHLEFRGWNHNLVALWCLHKPGVTPEAVQAASGRLARYRHQYNVIALPVFGPRGTDADAVGWVMYNTSGRELPVFHKGSPAPTWVKMKTTAGSDPGLIGAHGLARVGQASDPTGQVIWFVEGPSDLMALYAAIPPDLRETNLIICNAGGSNENPKPFMLDPFAGRAVRVIRDADTAGEAGAEKWSNWLVGAAAEIRRIRLPYPITPDHGRDLRDWINEGHTFAELEQLAADSAPTAAPGPEASGEGPKPNEADDDPHRLARVYLDRFSTHPEFGVVLRYWRQDWWRWESPGIYRRMPQEVTDGELTSDVKAEFDRINLESQQLAQDGDEMPTSQRVTRALVGNVLGAVQSVCVLASQNAKDQPEWL